jgi:hypothetical protein
MNMFSDQIIWYICVWSLEKQITNLYTMRFDGFLPSKGLKLLMSSYKKYKESWKIMKQTTL